MVILVLSLLEPWMTISFQYLRVDYIPLDLFTLMLPSSKPSSFELEVVLTLFRSASPEVSDAPLCFVAHATLTFLAVVLGLASIILDLKVGYAAAMFCTVFSPSLLTLSMARMYAKPPPAFASTSYSLGLGILLAAISSIFYVLSIFMPGERGR